MSNAEIDNYAEQFLIDYNPSALKNPQPVNIEAFAEIYLDLTVDYTYLSHCGLILGRMVFQDTVRVPIYLPEENCADYLYENVMAHMLNPEIEYYPIKTIGVDEVLDTMMLKKFPERIRVEWSNTQKRKYPMNICQHCGTKQGEYFIYEKINRMIKK